MNNLKYKLILPSLVGVSIIASYDWMRVVSKSVFLKYFSADLFPLAFGLMIFVLFFSLLAYDKILSKLGPHITYQVMNAFWIIVFLIHYFLLKSEIKFAAFTLTLLRPIYVMMLLEQVWAYFNTINNTESAKKLSGIMMAIVSVATILSGTILKNYVKQIGTENAIWISTIALIPGAMIMFKLLKSVNIEKKKKELPLGLAQLKKMPTLYSLFFIIILSQIFTGVTEYKLDTLVEATIIDTDERSVFYADLFRNINAGALIFQLFILPLIFSKIFLGHIHIAIPLIHFAFSIFIYFKPELTFVSISFLIFKAIDYSIFRGAKELIYVPLSTEIKYRTKQFIDVFGYRFGSGAFAIIFAILNYIKDEENKLALASLAQTIWQFAYDYSALMSTGLWLYLSFIISRQLRKNQETYQ